MLIRSIQACFQRSLQFSHVEFPQLVFTNKAWFQQKKTFLQLKQHRECVWCQGAQWGRVGVGWRHGGGGVVGIQ